MMLQKSYLKRHSRLKTFHDGNKVPGNLVMYGGVLIILTGLIFMMMNFYHADSVLSIWLPFMIAGVVLVFVSTLIRPRSHKLKR